MEYKTRPKLKDSVFTKLFSDKANLKELYATLHQDADNITEDDIELVSLQNVIAQKQYNDLGMCVNGKLIILLEAQSTYCPNIPIRMLMYLADTYREWIHEYMLDAYSSSQFPLPQPELYVVYTGDRGSVPDEFRLSEMIGENKYVELCVDVICVESTKNILGQYIAFCHLVDETRCQGRKSKVTAKKIVEESIQKGILVDFMRKHEKEVIDMLTALFNQEYVDEMRENRLRKEAKEETVGAINKVYRRLIQTGKEKEAMRFMMDDEYQRQILKAYGFDK